MTTTPKFFRYQNSFLQSFLYTAEANEATSGFLPLIDEALELIFAGHNSPFLVNVTVRDYLFDGVQICKNGCEDDGFVAKMACGKIKDNLKVAKQMRLHKKDILFATFHYVCVISLFC